MGRNEEMLEGISTTIPDQRESEQRSEGDEMLCWMQDLFPICRSITGNGVRQTLDYVRRIVPLQIHEIPSGTRVFDWVVPDEWNIEDAWLEHESGRRIIDFKELNLCVLGYSTPVDVWLSREELLPHLYSLSEMPGVTPYVTSYYERRWGFCLPDTIKRSLPEGKYHAYIDSRLGKGSLTYADLVVPGDQNKEIVVSTYVCHPSMANDNLSGVVLTTAVARAVAMLPRRRFTYRFVWVPETIGAISYLFLKGQHLSRYLHAGIVATCVGDRGVIHYKKSRRGDAEIDKAAQYVLQHSGKAFEVLDFFPWGSDERQYCSPGFNLPFGSLMSSPYGMYPEYHSSADNVGIISAERLTEMFGLYLEVFSTLELNGRYIRVDPYCEPHLGRRGLYPTVGSQKQTANQIKIQNWVLNLAGPDTDLFEMSKRTSFKHSDLAQTAENLVAHGLLSPYEP
jgi:aminopeptidase-like protein